MEKNNIEFESISKWFNSLPKEKQMEIIECIDDMFKEETKKKHD